MSRDSLDFVSYYRIALWLTGRVQSHVEGSVGPRKQRGYSPTATTSETAKEPVFCPQDLQLDETSQKLLWNEFFRQEKEGFTEL